MTDTAGKQPSDPGPAGGSDMSRTAGYALIGCLAKAHNRPFSETALRSGLPAGHVMTGPAEIARALELVGLKSRLVPIRPRKIDPGVLPCVIFDRDGSQAVLLRIDRKRKTATIVRPDQGQLEEELRFRTLGRTFVDQALLVAPANDRNESHLDPYTSQKGRSQRHWFWGPVAENWTAWVQILVAAFCLNLLNLALPIFVMNVYDRVIPNLAFVTLWTLAIGVVVALLLDLALRTLRSGVLEALARRVDIRVASRLFDQVMNARLMSRPGGAAGMVNSIRDFETVRDFFGSASFVAMIDLLFIGLFVAVLFLVVGPLAYVPLIAIPVVLLLALIAQSPIARSAKKAQQLATKRHVVLVESLLGIEAVKSLNAEPVMQREWESAVAAASRISGQTRFWSSLATSGTQFVQQGVSVAIIVWGVFLVANNEITVGALIAANILAGRVLAPLAAIAQTIFRANYAYRSMQALGELMKLPREREDAVQNDLKVSDGAIAFRDVTYRYPGAEHPALLNASFAIEPGETVALLGRVGSGKTTTGKLLNGLLVPDSGNILIESHGIAQFDPAELRDGIGYLTQDSDLFTGTLRENVRIGRPWASDEDIKQALYLAGMDDFARANPEGLNLFIGEKGSRLSGGQKQGVCLARLLLRQPKVLFLDEPTNSMDQQMEAAVIERLQSFGESKTTLILCTHRMSLANIADRFIVLDKGSVVLDGPKQAVIDQLKNARPRQVEG